MEGFFNSSSDGILPNTPKLANNKRRINIPAKPKKMRQKIRTALFML
jgi:hypothetical protein